MRPSNGELLVTGVERGYACPAYADSWSEFGRPRALAASGGWILERDIPSEDARDAMGCYPLFCCSDWSMLKSDLDKISGDDLVSLVLVADPFGNYSEGLLRATFGDLSVPFKKHFIADLEKAPLAFVSKHHQYYARKALEKVRVEWCEDPIGRLNEWSALYGELSARHRLQGMQAFSQAAFAKQLSVPGMSVLRATHEGETVGAHLWYVQGEVAYSHLAASSARGYKLMAAYALAWRALEQFAGRVSWLDWGAAAGRDVDRADGLARFKRGWANDERPAYLCGRIFNRSKYDELAQARGLNEICYFPAYRKGEFG